jgi:hypothetical protein
MPKNDDLLEKMAVEELGRKKMASSDNGTLMNDVLAELAGIRKGKSQTMSVRVSNDVYDVLRKQSRKYDITMSALCGGLLEKIVKET